MRQRIPVAALMCFCAALLPAQTSLKSVWTPVFSDEFDTNELDFTRWSPHSGIRENGPRPEGVRLVPAAIDLRDGRARITARQEGGFFTSGTMSTYGTFAQMYGKFEIRFRAPAGKGFESRFRLLPVSAAAIPSIDLVRVLGTSSEQAVFGNTWGDEKAERSYSGSWNAALNKDGFHIVSVEWEADRIVWFLDGKERFRSVDGVPRQPMYLEADLHISGGEAKWPDATTQFPASLEIDYVRVYKR